MFPGRRDVGLSSHTRTSRMKNFSNPAYWLTGLILLVCAFILFGFTPTPPDAHKAAVRVQANGWHGSGVHIGNGFILTAGHVTENAEGLVVKTDGGQVHKAEVLWLNHAFDVSLVYVDDMKDESGAPLSCEKTTVGQSVTIIGNPLDTDFAQSWGRVSGFGKTGLENLDKRGLWRSLVTLDVTAAPGVSGGPVYDDQDNVVGILVAGAISMRGTFGYSYMVPSTAICHIMGRAI
ncbi:hypothetical protein CIT31_16545 [Mesorhizobium wenxiniae]|uniref:Serine protease n=2 Tax=Mesorhizobium wenxiniae TaxID=2014805 RepID=A0A271KG20_9HYPH|nr:hypothetical protein CIT31_16545 [Mesorhizobium wenxiniae]